MFCLKCGSEIKYGETSCPQCGAVSPVTRCTSVGGWIGWILLCTLLPFIGAIITVCTTKDPSVKNAVLASILLGVIFVIIFIVFIILGLFSISGAFFN